MFLQIIKLLGSVKLTGYLHNFVYSQTLTQVFSKLFEFSKFKSYVAVEFFGLLIYTSTQQDSSSTLHIFIFHIFSSHISFSNSSMQSMFCQPVFWFSFPSQMQFPLSTLSWEYGQGQSLIIQEDFKCFQLSVKVGLLEPGESFSLLFQSGHLRIRHTCVSQPCCPLDQV